MIFKEQKNMWEHIELGEEDYAVIQVLLIPSGKQAMAHKKVMTTSQGPQTDGNCSIVQAVQHTYIWITF